MSIQQFKRFLRCGDDDVQTQIINLLKDLRDIIVRQQEQINTLRERISDIDKDLYAIAPEMEIIKTATYADENPEEAEMLKDLYLNHNLDYYEDLDSYKQTYQAVKTEMAEKLGCELPYADLRDLVMHRYRQQRSEDL